MTSEYSNIVDITLERYITLFTKFEVAYHDKSILKKALQVSNVPKMDSYPRKTVVTSTIATGYFAIIYTLHTVPCRIPSNVELAFILQIIGKF